MGETEGKKDEADYKRLQTFPLVRHSDMPEEMRVETMELCVTACEKFSNNNESAAKMIKETMDKKFGSSWHVVIGEGFGFEITHEEEPVLSRDTGSFLPSSSGEEVTLQKPLPQPDPRLNKPLPLIGPLAPSSPALARGPTAFPHVLSSLPSRQAANLLYRLHLCTWAPMAEGVGVTEPPARLLGQECAHHEACFGRETWPASYFSSGTAC
uniref:Dynein light chain n=1 Tax=Felis catus TaxID=9685 RepID=A0ABI7XVZ9_FELCA